MVAEVQREGLIDDVSEHENLLDIGSCRNWQCHLISSKLLWWSNRLSCSGVPSDLTVDQLLLMLWSVWIHRACKHIFPTILSWKCIALCILHLIVGKVQHTQSNLSYFNLSLNSREASRSWSSNAWKPWRCIWSETNPIIMLTAVDGGVVIDWGYVPSKYAILIVRRVSGIILLRLWSWNVVIQSRRRRSLVRVFIADVKVAWLFRHWSVVLVSQGIWLS